MILAARNPVAGVRGTFEVCPALPSEYLERLRLAGERLGDDVRFHGVVVTAAGWQLVISQRHIPGRPPTAAEVAGFFRAHQFRAVNAKTYYRAEDNLLVGDAHTANLKRVATGDVLPFDLLICQPDAALRACVEAPEELSF